MAAYEHLPAYCGRILVRHSRSLAVYSEADFREFRYYPAADTPEQRLLVC